jgi:hypothetical protein
MLKSNRVGFFICLTLILILVSASAISKSRGHPRPSINTASQAAQSADVPGTIDGAKNPELIPDQSKAPGMNILFFVLVVCAAIVGVINVALLLVWLKGTGSLMFPWLRLLITMPMILVLSGFIQLTLVVVAAIVDRYRGAATDIVIRSL